MILGVSSFAYGWSVGDEIHKPIHPMNELSLIEIATKFKLSCLQIGDNLPVHVLTEEQLIALKVASEKNSIRLELGAKELTADNLARYIKLCSKLNAPLLRFIIDGAQYAPTSSTVISLVKDALPLLIDAKITLGIENHDRFKAKELASIMDAIGSDHVGICLDCVNSMGAGEGLEYVVDILAPYTVNLHIKDFTVQRLPHKMGFTVTGIHVGKGMTNIPLLMEKLINYKRCQSAVLEQWVPWQENLATTINTEREWAAEGINYLKSLPYFVKRNNKFNTIL